MALETTSSTLSGSMPRLVVGAVMEAHDTIVLLPRIRTRVLGQGEGVQATYTILGTLSPADVTEGTAMANTAVSHSAVNITVAQRGIKVSVTDVAARASNLGLEGVLSNVFRQVAQDVDSKVAALFTGFTSNTQIDGATMTSALVFDALGAVLAGTGNQALYSPDFTLALHTKQYMSLCKDLSANGTPLSQTPIMQGVASGNLASLYGVPIAVTNRIADAGTGQKSGALFHRDALGCVIRWAPRIVSLEHPDVGGGPGTISSVTHCSGFSELVDAYGVEIVTD